MWYQLYFIIIVALILLDIFTANNMDEDAFSPSFHHEDNNTVVFPGISPYTAQVLQYRFVVYYGKITS